MFLFSSPLKGSQEQRTGLLLRRGERWAEVSPLPGWSQETLFKSIEQLSAGRSVVSPFPSVAFGLSSLSTPLLSPFSLPIAALLRGTPGEMERQAEVALKAGYTHAKVKVGHLCPKEAERLIRSLLPHFQLRIDVNREWHGDDSMEFFSHFPLGSFEWVEEPLADLKGLSVFPHPFALDESFRADPSLLDHPPPLFRALVIKPTLTGSVNHCAQVARKAHEKGIAVVISGAYESGVGTYHLALLAKRLQHPTTAAGLDPYNSILADVLKERLKIKRGRLYIPHCICIDVSQLISV